MEIGLYIRICVLIVSILLVFCWICFGPKGFF